MQVTDDYPEMPPFLKRNNPPTPKQSEKVMSKVDEDDLVEEVEAEEAPPPAPKPEKVKKAKVERKRDPAKLDQYGFRKGSIKSEAAVMYSSKKGATLAEVKERVGSVQFNLLKEVEELGFKIKREQEDGEGKRKVTRFFIQAK